MLEENDVPTTSLKGCLRARPYSFGYDGIQNSHESTRRRSNFRFNVLADDMIDIADGGANDWIERDGPDGDKVRVFDPENFRRPSSR